MLHFAKENRYYVPLLFKDHSFQCKYNLFCYDKLGLTLDKTDTDYDLRKGNRSVFLSFPKFTQQYTQYYQDVLISERCHSPAESLQMLEDLYQEFLEKNSL